MKRTMTLETTAVPFCDGSQIWVGFGKRGVSFLNKVVSFCTSD